MHRFLHRRRGTTLIELIIFIAVVGIVMAMAIPILFTATEDRLLQQTVSAVEHNGTQVIQNISQRVRHGERILSPAPGQTGAILMLQTGTGATNPTMIGLLSGSVVAIEHTTLETISSSQVAVEDLVFRNTSQSDDRQSVHMNFRVSRTIRLQLPRSYGRIFEATVSLFPDDVIVGDACGCVEPSCANGVISWEVCESSTCYVVDTAMDCR